MGAIEPALAQRDSRFFSKSKRSTAAPSPYFHARSASASITFTRSHI
jgi:hypothetical protein